MRTQSVWSSEVPTDLAGLRRWVQLGRGLPDPGRGRSHDRLTGLRDASRGCGSIGRLFEAHEDAVAILHEACRRPRIGAMYAVWASRHGGGPELRPAPDGSLELNGVQRFAGGAAVAERALVEVGANGSSRLVDLDLAASGVRIIERSWPSEAFPHAGIRTVEFDRVAIADADLVGPPGWYTARTGFWQGSIGVAAGWTGLVQAFVDGVEDAVRPSARRGRVTAELWGMEANLLAAAAWVDQHPEVDAAAVALSCRRQVADGGHRVVRDLLDGAGPALLAFNGDMARRHLEIQLALGQHHHDADAELLGSIGGP